jgi:hypothetical protein
MRYLYRSTVLWLGGLSLLMLGPAPRIARAQPESLADWAGKTYLEEKSVNTKYSSELGNVLRTGNFGPSGQQAFDDYYKKQVFPLVTQPATRGQQKTDVVAKLHSDFKALNRFPGSPAQLELIAITLDYMSGIAVDGKRHPAARINAILAMGEVKSPDTVTRLMKLVTDRNLHSAFRVAAAAELVHLADLGVMADPAVAAQVVPLMVKVVGNDNLRSDEWRWMRGQAADIIGIVGDAGPNGEVAKALIVMLADPALPFTQRGKAARALGRLNYNGEVPNVAAYIQAVAEFGSDALTPDLPAVVRRLRAIAVALVGDLGKEPGALAPLLKLGAVPKKVHDMNTAMDELRLLCNTKIGPDGTPQPPSEELLKAAARKAKSSMDAAAGRKSK